MKAINQISYGILLGLTLPIVAGMLYISFLYPRELSTIEILKNIFPGPIFGKLIILSIVPDLLLIFIFYKFDFFKIGTGILISTLPFVILCIIMFN